jgi:hypothetical protein
MHARARRSLQRSVAQPHAGCAGVDFSTLRGTRRTVVIPHEPLSGFIFLHAVHHDAAWSLSLMSLP